MTTPDPLSLSLISIFLLFCSDLSAVCSSLEMFCFGFGFVKFIGVFFIASMALLNAGFVDGGECVLEGIFMRSCTFWLDTFFVDQNSDHPSDFVKFMISALNSVELAFCGVGVNLSPLHSRFFSCSVNLWDEKLNIFGQILVMCGAVWLVVSVGVLGCPLLRLVEVVVVSWLSSPR